MENDKNKQAPASQPTDTTPQDAQRAPAQAPTPPNTPDVPRQSDRR